jgi:hypothetical protein
VQRTRASLPERSAGRTFAPIKKVSSETTNAIRFSGWIKNQAIKGKQNTVVNFSGENRSPRRIYLAWRAGNLYTDIDCGFKLHLYPSHLERDVGHDITEFKFVKVGKGKIYRGVMTVPITAYSDSRTYWVDVALGYVTNISGLKRQAGDGPARFNGLFNSRIISVGPGRLVVDVEKL